MSHYLRQYSVPLNSSTPMEFSLYEKIIRDVLHHIYARMCALHEKVDLHVHLGTCTPVSIRCVTRQRTVLLTGSQRPSLSHTAFPLLPSATVCMYGDDVACVRWTGTLCHSRLVVRARTLLGRDVASLLVIGVYGRLLGVTYPASHVCVQSLCLLGLSLYSCNTWIWVDLVMDFSSQIFHLRSAAGRGVG
jgi:hypothetical protein